MVRKVIVIISCLVLIFAFGVTAQAATHNVYTDGNISSTYVTYFKDILSGVSFKDNYVAFRSGQYSYTMVVGDLEYDENSKTFTLSSPGREYSFTTNNSGYNSYYSYDSVTIDSFELRVDNNIIYSDLGYFPQLIERGAKYEMLSAVLIVVALLGVVIGRIFKHS